VYLFAIAGVPHIMCCAHPASFLVAGFDPEGAEQLGGVVSGSCKEIGSTEVAAMLRFFGVDARVVDFLVRD
jgi:hypothetical protein